LRTQGNSCLMLSQIYNWKVVDNKTLLVEDNFHNWFRLSLMAYCPNLPFKMRLGFKSIGGTGLSCLSKGDEVISHDFGMGRYNCPIVKIEQVPPPAPKAQTQGG